MFRMIAPLLEGFLTAALHDLDFVAWLTSRRGSGFVDVLREFQSDLYNLCRERGW